ncbi:putative membrane protein [Clostridium botulinum]|nr:putative membrane protein [Clostridium botulinum CDC_297]AJE11464.1 putative membrane protein [Clostridium botulinum CDC_1436]APR01606.1 putative membrane protein [Clostridium botulinum]APU59869.1 putative membrane protein [Clostridium botulinum]
MKDIIIILALIIGVVMLVVGKKTKKYKYVNATE